MGVRALLFDTRSIQRYIYSGNMLRTNIGASYLVDRLFEKVLIEQTLKKDLFPEKDAVDDISWNPKDDEGDDNSRNSNEKLTAKFNPGCLCKVVYIGGGNALLLFSSEAAEGIEKEVVSAFTKKVLEQCPGLQTGAAIGEMDFTSKEKMQKSFSDLRVQLKKNQSCIIPRVNVAQTGLTLECDVNGECANYCDCDHDIKPGKEVRFFSQEVYAKTIAAQKANGWLKAEINKIFEKHGKENLLDGYEFPSELEDLGQTEGENYIAIVHVDGNNMGERFAQNESLNQYKDMSRQVRHKTWESFAFLVEDIVQSIKVQPEWYNDWLKLKTKKGDTLLPIRPIILGGDDVTFVCAAKVALQYTKKFMEYMMQPDPSVKVTLQPAQKGKKKDKSNTVNDGSIPCCAGIAIVNTSYPFYRGYRLAEQACGAAKSVSRNSGGSSWLDFVFLHGEQEPTLEQIRQHDYKGAQGNMHFGPYLVSVKESDKKNEKNLQNLFACIEKIHYSKDRNLPDMPMNKVKMMRDVLQHGKHETRKFLEQLKISFNPQNQTETAKYTFPFKVAAWERYEETLWAEDSKKKELTTPYVDVIEMMDFYKPEGK